MSIIAQSETVVPSNLRELSTVMVSVLIRAAPCSVGRSREAPILAPEYSVEHFSGSSAVPRTSPELSLSARSEFSVGSRSFSPQASGIPQPER
ncbi:MAG: hypothetical protein J6A19_07985 [Oscillospiraceae bacterium]|nr:hypothetical protein [Oscillospiraceae bacterium]